MTFHPISLFSLYYYPLLCHTFNPLRLALISSCRSPFKLVLILCILFNCLSHKWVTSVRPTLHRTLLSSFFPLWTTSGLLKVLCEELRVGVTKLFRTLFWRRGVGNGLIESRLSRLSICCKELLRFLESSRNIFYFDFWLLCHVNYQIPMWLCYKTFKHWYKILVRDYHILVHWRTSEYT